jgi:alpha-L-fucosidase
MNTQVIRTVGALGLWLLLGAAWVAAEEPSKPWMKPDPAAVQRWQDMRFGMFIHWGPVSLTGHEIGWSRGKETPVEEYDALYKKFNPTKFDADAWVAVAKTAGMKYIVLTTKHHDGFCLWDTKLTDYNIMNTPFHRDVVKELSEACKRQGIAFGTYYSVCDWYHPDFPLTSPGGKVKREKSDLDAYQRYLLGQIKELITNYGPLLTIWNDVPQVFKERGVETIKMARTMQPDILMNNRTGDGGDYDTPEQRIGAFQNTRPWETCMTICHQWSWKPNDEMKTLPQCLKTLVRTAGGDGNLLFNVGPTALGEIEPRQAERLKEMGQWLAKYGESIYGTRGGPYKPVRWVVSTRKDHTVYLHILAWPNETLSLPALPAKIVASRLLTGGQVQVNQTDAAVEISVPQSNRQEINTIVAMELDRPAMEIEPIVVPGLGSSLTERKKATASSVYRKTPASFGPAWAVDDDPDTRWVADPAAKKSWLEVDLGQPATFDHALIDEQAGDDAGVTSFELQYRDGNAWKTFYQGATIGKNCRVQFKPVTARRVRLTLESQGGAAINEFQLFAPASGKSSP